MEDDDERHSPERPTSPIHMPSFERAKRRLLVRRRQLIGSGGAPAGIGNAALRHTGSGSSPLTSPTGNVPTLPRLLVARVPQDRASRSNRFTQNITTDYEQGFESDRSSRSEGEVLAAATIGFAASPPRSHGLSVSSSPPTHCTRRGIRGSMSSHMSSAVELLPILPNALSEHVALMGFDSVKLEESILPSHVAKLVGSTGERLSSISNRSCWRGDLMLVPLYLGIFRDLSARPYDHTSEIDGLSRPAGLEASVRPAGDVGPPEGRLSAPSMPFPWPILDMVDFEFGGGAEVEGTDLELVVIVLNLPTLTDVSASGGGAIEGEPMAGVREDPADAYDAMLAPLLRLMLARAGPVKSVSLRPPIVGGAARRVVGEDGGNEAIALRGVKGTLGLAFIEMSSRAQTERAVQALDGFPWSVNRILQARRFRDYGSELSTEERPPVDPVLSHRSMLTDEDDESARGPPSIRSLLDDESSLAARSATSRGPSPEPVEGSGGRVSSARSQETVEACALVEGVLSILRGPEAGGELRELEERLKEAMREGDVQRVSHVEVELLRACYGSDEGVRGTNVASDDDDMSWTDLRRDLEQLVLNLFTDCQDQGSDGDRNESCLVERCLLAERLRTSTMMLRLRRAESRAASLSREVAQKLSTINLLQHQRSNLFAHMRRLRNANRALQDRQEDLMVRARASSLDDDAELKEVAPAKDSPSEAGSSTPLHSLQQATTTLMAASRRDGTTVESLAGAEKCLEEALQSVRRRKEQLIREAQMDLLRRKEEEEEARLCVICQDQRRDSLLLPCRHLCVCRQCSEPLSRCPVCRQDIAEKMKVYA